MSRRIRRFACCCFGVLGLSAASALSAPARIELQVLEPVERGQAVQSFPVAVGLLFPDGEIKSAPGGRIVDDQGHVVPFEAEATGWWSPEKDRIKWLLIRFAASTDRRYFYEAGEKPPAASGEPIGREDAAAIRISTGPLQVTISRTEPQLFGEVLLNGKPMIQNAPSVLVLTADAAGTETLGRLTDWEARLEEATVARASVKASGCYRFPDGKPIARLDLRYEFFKDESFVRVYHTLTWMVKDYQIGAREISVRLRPALGDAGKVRIGLSDYAADAWTKEWKPESRLSAFQDDANHFSVESDGSQQTSGKRLGGWIALEGADGRQVGVSLRHTWQMFPKAFSVENGEMRIGLWPRQGPPMSFEYSAIMPPDFYNDPCWKSFWWSKEEGHYMNEYERERLADGKIVNSPYFLHTAEGVARTHEMTFFFLDGGARRTAAELNSVTQHPVVLRQDPASAMRVPFMGFKIEPVNAAYPDLERALDVLGRMVTSRWVASHDYGFWRFGMVWWGNRLERGSLYRWSDGVQYDQQLLPWMLFMRGGGRELYENGEILGRFGMDACTNHYNTLGSPTGYMGTAGGGMSFPFMKFTPWNMKGQKVHFLSYYYHLTGYRRAHEVMDEVIAGTKEATVKFSDKPEGRVGSGREINNMNVFWVNACEETWDPQVKERARECLELTINREYDPAKNTFRPPGVYRFNGLILQDQFWQDERLKKIMLRYLEGHLLRYERDGGIDDVEATIACDWAYRQTRDKRYTLVGWDVSRQLADVLPDQDFSSEAVPRYTMWGNSIYREFLGPILFNASLGYRMGYRLDEPFQLRSTFLSLDYEGKNGGRGEVFVRARRDGDLALRVLIGELRRPKSEPVSVAAFRPDAQEPARIHIEGAAGEMTLPGLRKGMVCRLAFEGKPTTIVLVLGDADIVNHIPNGTLYGTETLAGQSYTGDRVYTRTTKDEVVVNLAAPAISGYTIRDADTWSVLYRASTAVKGPVTLKLGKGRLLCIIGTGYGHHDRRSEQGVAPYYSVTPEGWFDPTAPEGPKPEK